MRENEQLNNGTAKADGPGFMNATGKLMFRLTNDYLFHVVMQWNEKV